VPVQRAVPVVVADEIPEPPILPPNLQRYSPPNALAFEKFGRKTAREQTSEADIVRRALEAYRFLDEVKTEGGQILLQRKDGRIERLMRL
jgi:hypothetical protein